MARRAGFASLRAGADGGRERIGLETAESQTRRRALLHADAALLGVLPRSQVQGRGARQHQ